MGLLAIGGTLLGLPLAFGAVRLLIWLDPEALPRAQDIHVDIRILAFASFLRWRRLCYSESSPRFEDRE